MDLENKKAIIHLREQDIGYTEIAKRLDLSVNTVKSFCKRNNLGGTKAIDINSCENCQKELIQKKGRKLKRFCCDSCRSSWWNRNGKLNNSPSIRSKTCVYCKEEFYTYSSTNQKYCSHDCYIEDRFGGGLCK